MKIAVVYNEPVSGRADSIDVLDEVSLVTDSLKELGHDFKVFPVGDRRGTYSLSESVFLLLISLRKYAPNIIFNLIEEFKGESSHQLYFLLMFELANYSFTGSHYEAVLTTNDKGLSKMIMKKFRIATTLYQEYSGQEIKISIPPPWIVKPALEDSSIGIDDSSVCDDIAKLTSVLPSMYKTYRKQPILIEKYIDGREFNISLLETVSGNTRVLPIAEMFFHDWPGEKPKIVGYKAKWNRESFEYKNILRQFNPYDAPLSQLSYLALKCWKIFNLSGYARIDMRMDKERNIFVIDVNANPCIAPDSGFIAAAKEGGYEAKDVIKEIIDAAYIYSKKSKKDLLKHHI